MAAEKDPIVCTQLRVPRELWRQVRHAAVDAEVSTNAFVVRQLEAAVARGRDPVHSA